MLLRTLSVGLAEEVVHGFNRLVGDYDTSIYQWSTRNAIFRSHEGSKKLSLPN